MNGPNAANFRGFAAEADALLDPAGVKVALDVGSRDGEVAVYLKQHYPAAQVYAFECNPPAVELCRRRFRDVPGISLVERAVSDHSGPVDFFAIDPERTVTPHADGNIGASSLFRANSEYPFEKYAQNRIPVQATTLADWARAAGHPTIDVIWMDVQGAALQALRGLGGLLPAVKLIHVEVEYKPMYLEQPLAGEVRSFLEAGGFRLVAQLNSSDWFGDEIYCRRDLLPWHRRWFGGPKRVPPPAP